MRRFAGLAFAALLLAPAGLRLASAWSGPDAAAMLCAIACGHEAKPGAVCCPMRPERASVPSWSACGGNGPAALVSPPASQPAVLPVRLFPAVPARGAVPEIADAASPRTLPFPPPDPVPLLLT